MDDAIKILVVDDDDSGREALSRLLSLAGYDVTSAATGESALDLIDCQQYQVIVSDLFLPDKNGFDVLQSVRKVSPASEVIVVTGHASAQSAVRAMKEGAFDYITKPIDFDELKIVVLKALEKQKLMSENKYLRQQLQGRFEFDNIIGNSPAMSLVFERMSRIVKTDSAVLVSGESGTGKELVARALHYNGTRRERPFVAVNCSAIPEALLESELFGHVRGAFTGAVKDKPGKFEAANHGTIFLDEIGTLPLHLQSKLLRVLQEHEVERVGSNKTVKFHVRVISATNSDLESMVKRGAFREDLYYRLNVIPLHLPPLRERQQDIMHLTAFFLEKQCRLLGRAPCSISKQALEALERYSWPGNVRELENLIERMIVLTDAAIINLDDVPATIVGEKPAGDMCCVKMPSGGVDLVATISRIEHSLISEALESAGGVKAKAAALLGINRTTLVEKIKRLKI
ncbi:MAG: sigma-54 dependent transcriptional regulator [Desulfuromonadaceae bacterium]|nr:sigma-54 dependent transcriptional regulator [Desulfuromonadaceae bacterium]MDD2847892.1 sigma-54 dependent transcriptional regulator [Desulfuromonadaceae bacterium]MDD4129563.1 sigma-54 dependent transcriptional regulator [Desulfuromonadaceae bacterium]